MKKLLPAINLILVLSITTKAQTLWHKEYLGKPTNTSIAVQLMFLDSAEISVQYGTSSGVYPNQTSWQVFGDSSSAEIVISGLTPDTKYYYRVLYRHPSTTVTTTRPEFTFHTQRPPGSTFTFVVQADPHMDNLTDTAMYRLAIKNQLEDNPDFMIDLGDFLMTDKLLNSAHVVPFDTIPYRCNMLRNRYETESACVPIYNTIGNHEGECGWFNNGTANNYAVWDANERNKYFLNPAPDNFYTGDTSITPYVGQRKSYYAWQWGDALFIVLDAYWYTNPKPDSLHGWRWTLGKNQYDWLKTTLENSTATYKFVFAHQLIGGDTEGRGGVERANFYEWGGENIDSTAGFAANRPGWYKPIKDLLTEHHVNIFFHGHDHFFGKQEKDCMIYQETPQPSMPNFSNPPNQAAVYGYLQGQILPNAGHLRLTVSPTGVQVQYVRVFLPTQETASRHNKDVSATYYINTPNCYDSLATGTPVLWNSNYNDELIYPNPFLQETKIEFSLLKAEKINLTIFNENGQIVRRLIAGSIVPEGKFDIIWDGKDSNGSSLAAGVYYYSIQGEIGNEKKGKVVLMK